MPENREGNREVTGGATDTARSRLEPRELALFALDAALDKKALEPVLIDLTGESSYTDYILLVSGRSDRHVQHVADGILEAFAQKLGRRPLGAEGKTDGRWVLLDFGEVVVHVFYHPMREFYDLEGLWCDAPRVAIDVPDEARAHAHSIY
jgi:ribosome-associated protein